MRAEARMAVFLAGRTLREGAADRCDVLTGCGRLVAGRCAFVPCATAGFFLAGRGCAAAGGPLGAAL